MDDQTIHDLGVIIGFLSFGYVLGRVLGAIYDWVAWRLRKAFRDFKNKYKFKIGDKVIFVNDFGVVYLWTIAELTTWEKLDGTEVPAYHPEGTQTPWYPYEQSRLKKATKVDLLLTPEQLQQKYGFKPTEWYGCY